MTPADPVLGAALTSQYHLASYRDGDFENPIRTTFDGAGSCLHILLPGETIELWASLPGHTQAFAFSDGLSATHATPVTFHHPDLDMPPHNVTLSIVPESEVKQPVPRV
jgi:hypothetical protein